MCVKIVNVHKGVVLLLVWCILGFSVHQAHAATSSLRSLWCTATAFFGFPCEPDTETPVIPVTNSAPSRGSEAHTPPMLPFDYETPQTQVETQEEVAKLPPVAPDEIVVTPETQETQEDTIEDVDDDKEITDVDEDEATDDTSGADEEGEDILTVTEEEESDEVYVDKEEIQEVVEESENESDVTQNDVE